MLGEFEGHMGGGVPDGEGQGQAGGDEDDAEEFGDGAQAVAGGEVAGEQCGGADGSVSGGLVEAGCQSAAGRSDEVDLHVDGHRPGQALVEAEQDVRGDDPVPGRCPGEHEGDGDSEQPSGEEELPAAEARGQGSGGKVGQGLGETEGDDEREDRQVAGQAEDIGADERHGGAFQAHEAADGDVDDDEEGELEPVLPQPEAHGGSGGPLRRGGCRHTWASLRGTGGGPDREPATGRAGRKRRRGQMNASASMKAATASSA